MQNRVLSKRENILLIILITIMLVGIYYLFVFRPVQVTLDNLALEKENVQSEMTYNEQVYQLIEAMKIELDRINQLPKSQITEIPLFDNEDALLQKLRTILSETLEYNMSFSPNEIEAKTVRKKINISFTIEGYDKMNRLVEKIHNTGYRFLINELQYSVTDQQEEEVMEQDEEQQEEQQKLEQIYSVTMGITFFERTE